MQSPYALGNDALYRRWRAWKLKDYPARTELIVVDVGDPYNPSPTETQELLRVCRKTNMAVYRSQLGGAADSAAVPATAASSRGDGSFGDGGRRARSTRSESGGVAPASESASPRESGAAPGVALPPASLPSPDATLPLPSRDGVMPREGRDGPERPPSLEPKDILRRFGAHFGLDRLDSNLLADEDSITSIEVAPGKSGRGYIPYSNRRLLWHTDGYYNPETRRICAFLLHCVQPAAEGGENALLDPEIAYIRLRDANPDYVRALMAPDAMTIPPNTEDGAERPASVGPVFSVDSAGGNLHMRYTARTRSIVWKDDAATGAAVRFLEQLLADDSPSVFRYRLAAGEGLICNNVLHSRTAFSDNEQRGTRRLLYRARYYDRIAGTDTNEIFGS